MKRKTISEWQGRDPMDCESNNHSGDDTNIFVFIAGMLLLLGVMIGMFTLMFTFIN